MKLYKIAQLTNEEISSLQTLYNIGIKKTTEDRRPYEQAIIEFMQSPQWQETQQSQQVTDNPYGFYEGQQLTYTKKSGYRGSCTVEKINEDGTLSIIDHSGRRMPKFQPIQMGMNMFEEM